MERLRILHVNDVAGVASTLVDGLRFLGHDTTLLKMLLPGRNYSTLVKLFFIPARLNEIRKMNDRVRNLNADVIHIHYAYLGWMGILGRYPYYLHCHGTDVRLDLNHPIRRLWVIPALRNAKKVFYSTPDLGPIICSVRSDAVFMPNPVRVDRFSPEQRRIQNEPPNILLFSDLNDRVKGTEVAMQGLSLLHKRIPEVKINAIAKGDDLSGYQPIPWINFFPPVETENIPSFLHQFDIIVGQFAIGSIGLSELESLACGKPVICYFKFQEIYPEPSPILSTNSPDQVCKYLLDLISNPNLRMKIGQKGSIWVGKHHNYKRIAEMLVDQYTH